MSFLHLKNKTEPKYTEPHTDTIHKVVFDTKNKLLNTDFEEFEETGDLVKLLPRGAL